MIEVGRRRSRALDAMARDGAPTLTESASCTNCGAGPVGRYCAACGQRHVTPQDFTVRTFAHELLSEFVSLDGRFWLTLWTLVRHPGKLAREYFDGRGARYMRPLNLFLLLNLVFFVIQPHTGLLQWHLGGYLRGNAGAQALVDQKRAARADEAERERERRGESAAPPRLESMQIFESNFEATIQNLKKSMLLFGIPLFAVVLTAIYGTRHRIAEHLIFSTHFFAFLVFALTVLVPVIFAIMVRSLVLLHSPRSIVSVLGTEMALTIVLFLIYVSYLYSGLRRMYGDARPAGAIRAVSLSAASLLILAGFSLSMFRVTLWSM